MTKWNCESVTLGKRGGKVRLFLIFGCCRLLPCVDQFVLTENKIQGKAYRLGDVGGVGYLRRRPPTSEHVVAVLRACLFLFSRHFRGDTTTLQDENHELTPRIRLRRHRGSRRIEKRDRGLVETVFDHRTEKAALGRQGRINDLSSAT